MRNNDFTRAYSKGKNIVNPFIVIYVNKNRIGKTRVGITTSKKIGNAVTRNRARRVIKHALYDVLPQDVGGKDLILVARAKTAKIKSHELAKILKENFKKLDIIK